MTESGAKWRIRGKQMISVLLGCAGTVIFVMLALGFIPDNWVCDLCSQLRLVYASVLLICVALLLSLRSYKWAGFVFVGFAINALPILSMLNKSECPSYEATETITILNFNTEFQHNDEYNLLQTLIEARNPDIIALVEIDQRWLDGIAPTMHRYPYSKKIIAGAGMALYSKFPFERCDVRYFGRSHHPRILATVRIHEHHIHIMTTHPTTPQSNSGYLERNQELSLLGDEMRAMPSPKLLIGDLNCGPWSPAFAHLLASGLRDSEQGFGPQPSWPARKGNSRAPIFERDI